MFQKDSVYYFWLKPCDVMRCSRGGRHNIICTEPIQKDLCQSAISRTEALCINSSVINTHHAHKMQSRGTESNLVCADTLDEDALPDVVKKNQKNKQIKAGDSVWQVKHFHLDIFKAQMLTASVRGKKLTNCFAWTHQREFKAAW